MDLKEKILLENKRKVTKGVILAGGLGTRFLPATLAIAKELVTVGSKPILMYQLEDLYKAGVNDILIVGCDEKRESFYKFIFSDKKVKELTAKGKGVYLTEYLDLMKNIKIDYIDQFSNKTEVPVEFDADGNVTKTKINVNPYFEMVGSSGAIMAAREWANGEPFVVVNGDDLCIYSDGKSVTKEVIDVFAETGKTVEYAKEMSRDQIYKYSAIVFGDPVANGKGFEMLDIVEKPEPGTEPSNFMGFARYVFAGENEKSFENPSVFEDILGSKPRANGEYCITDVVQTRAKRGDGATCIFDGIYFDCGSKEGYSLANAYVGLIDDSSLNFHARLRELITITENQMNPVKKK